MVSIIVHVYNVAPYLTAREYLKTYGISETYCLYISQELVSVGFTCTTEDNVYFERFAYSQDEKYGKYSLGMVLYYGIICDLIAQGRKFFISPAVGLITKNDTMSHASTHIPGIFSKTGRKNSTILSGGI